AYREVEVHLSGPSGWHLGAPRAGTFVEAPLDAADAPSLTDGAYYSHSRVVGSVEVIRLKPGRYSIFYMDPTNGCASPDGPYGVRINVAFEIKPASAVYVGEIRSIEIFRSMGKVINPTHWHDPTRFRVS